jgi:signal transduction histidine kinase
MSDQESGVKFPLALKLGLSLLGASLIVAVFLLFYSGPRTAEDFSERTSQLIEMSREALGRTVHEDTEASRDLLINLIRHTTDARRRHMMDLPLSLYAGDMERIRSVVEETDARMSRRLEENVGILANEMEQRSLREAEARIDDITAEQAAMGEAVTADLRRAFLILTGVVFAALLLVLGFGLYRTVVHPIRKLQQGTLAVARGDLDVAVPAQSRDEVGGLAANFAVMVRQLRQSREDVRRKNRELEELNLNLEAEVDRKTRHLAQALDDLQRTQKQLIHVEKMASIGTLAGGVAHEFNNLIGGIRGCVSEALATEVDGERRETLEVIRRASVRAGEITDQLLRFSRQGAVNLRPLDPARTLEEALALIEPEARSRGVSVVRRIEAGAPIPADGDALHQVFLNLFTNALQAMTGGGELTVETERSAREMVIRVADTGAGIPAGDIDRIFEPFFTTKDEESDPAQRGAGLGLAVSYNIVTAHGGTLEAASGSGRGTVFTVRLPVAGDYGGRNAGREERRDG